MRTWKGAIGFVVLLSVGCFGTDNLGGDDIVEGTDTIGGTDTTGPEGFAALYSGYLNRCADCHAPGALGATAETEKSLDFSTAATAKATLKGTATGLVGNQQACNGVPFLAATYDQSLLAAVLDENLRTTFVAPSAAGCNGAGNVVSAMEIRVQGTMPANFLADLKVWIDGGAP